MTRDEFKPLFAKLMAASPNMKVHNETAKIYFDEMSRYTAEDFSRAVSVCISQSTGWLPGIKQLHDAIKASGAGCSLAEATKCIREILNISYSGSWSPQDYPEIVGKIINGLGNVTYLRGLDSDQFMRKIKAEYGVQTEMLELGIKPKEKSLRGGYRELRR